MLLFRLSESFLVYLMGDFCFGSGLSKSRVMLLLCHLELLDLLLEAINVNLQLLFDTDVLADVCLILL